MPEITSVVLSCNEMEVPRDFGSGRQRCVRDLVPARQDSRLKSVLPTNCGQIKTSDGSFCSFWLSNAVDSSLTVSKTEDPR